jgi:hypothetical protein
LSLTLYQADGVIWIVDLPDAIPGQTMWPEWNFDQAMAGCVLADQCYPPAHHEWPFSEDEG